MQHACCLVLLIAFRHAVLFGCCVLALARTCCLSFCDVVCMCILHALAMHFWKYFMHAAGCVQFGMQHTLVFLCVLACCSYGLHVLVMHFWVQYDYCVSSHCACTLQTFWSILGKHYASNMRAVFFRAFGLHFGMPFCSDVLPLFLGCCMHVCYMHWLCSCEHNLCMQKAVCSWRAEYTCVLVFASILHLCCLACIAPQQARHSITSTQVAFILHAFSTNFAAFRANTTLVTSMQHACCSGPFVSFVCNAYCVLLCSVASVHFDVQFLHWL